MNVIAEVCRRPVRHVSALYITIAIGLLLPVIPAEDAEDTREGEDVTLKCRFPPQVGALAPTFFWVRNNKHNQHDNVAIQQNPLDAYYRVDFKPEQGRYDLLISNASYERDNGLFACYVKEAGSGQDLHSQAFALTVLTPPGAPRVLPGPTPTLTEGKSAELTCSSTGGSPDPDIKWYKAGSEYPLDAELRPGNSRDAPTAAVLRVTPARGDDGAAYRCVVWNRALSDGSHLVTNVTLNVNYFPRVKVGPENPLRVERDAPVTLQCAVDAKPKVSSVRWSRNGRFVATALQHTISRVAVKDAGTYVCSADNGLGQAGEAELSLEVLYPPEVTVDNGSGASNHREAEEGETLVVRCNVSANPPPVTVEWLREDRPDFRQTGNQLLIGRVSAEDVGSYTCRAVNVLNPSAQGHPVEKVGNASFALLVRHKPGRAVISPDKPVVSEGATVTLTCAASPPGWPAPLFRWWRDGDGVFSAGSSAATQVLATGAQYVINPAQLGNEGQYHCQATNEMGHGEVASVMLEVHQAPRFINKLPSHYTRRKGDPGAFVQCSAQGKPKPSIKWIKDSTELTADQDTLEITTEESESGHNAVFTVQSTLHFVGSKRPGANQLLPSDRGVYSCVFENEVKRVESSMQLLVEHGPIELHQYNKVAYDLRETAEVVCRVQAYPRPEFEWSFGTTSSPLLTNGGHYEINTTSEGHDIYTSVLKIANLQDVDYGDYYCRVSNSLDSIKPAIRLQRKGPPERPLSISTPAIGPNFVTVKWEPGFDGGLQNTKFFVSYKQLTNFAGGKSSEDCSSANLGRRNNGDEWQEFECLRNNPCNVSGLEQHQSYVFKVKAFNSKGHSNYSDEIKATTTVDQIPTPRQVLFNPNSHMLLISTASTCLQLVAVVEAGAETINGDLEWFSVGEPLKMLVGMPSTYKEKISLVRRNSIPPGSSGRSLDELGDGIVPQTSISNKNLQVRVKLCLITEMNLCSSYIVADVNPSSVMEAGALAMPTLIAIIVSCVVFVLFLGLLFIFCRCKKNQNNKGSGKDYEMETSTVHPSLVSQQPPPPYYPSSGMENKALEHSLDLALDDAAKNPVYASQNGYGYHGNPPNRGAQGHPINGGINMGYMDNSYSNSNNGGSVNSQDSLWQMKMTASNNNANGSNDHHHSYGYDPLTHGGYGTVDDYASYPHMGNGSPTDTDYHQGQHGSNNPSRQDYSTDPYAAVHKSKKRIDQHLDSTYHDVSGLPDPYMDPLDCDDNKPQHISLSFDESLESGYSTPNSRNRRVIREIIV
ncbi:Down syndrome cell adhesion molecule-like protein Dscam2 [Gryllus bimaculatus]|nr:Down syndrome cell adhesion molecule-like protein Dscam2 [Gryllus bimaculatus]